MTYEAIKQHLDRRPFVPFTIHVSDGDRIGLKSAEFAFLHPRRTYLLVASDGSNLPLDRFVDLAHITQVITEDGFDVATPQQQKQ